MEDSGEIKCGEVGLDAVAAIACRKKCEQQTIAALLLCATTIVMIESEACRTTT